MEQKKIIIAIDGYSSCGKSTLAKALAKKLDYIFIDTGAMYRCVALFALRNKLVDEQNNIDSIGLVQQLYNIHISFQNETNGEVSVLLNNENVSDEIRQLSVASIVSEVAAIEDVRKHLVSQQQALGKKGGVIMDGRDVGTVVFPQAELKLFVTADPEIRAQRRYLELKNKGEDVQIEEIKANLIHRDLLDTTRKFGPLKQADDAILLDNTNLTQEEQLTIALKLVENKSKKVCSTKK